MHKKCLAISLDAERKINDKRLGLFSYVLLTVHLIIILVINQLDAQNLVL